MPTQARHPRSTTCGTSSVASSTASTGGPDRRPGLRALPHRGGRPGFHRVLGKRFGRDKVVTAHRARLTSASASMVSTGTDPGRRPRHRPGPGRRTAGAQPGRDQPRLARADTWTTAPRPTTAPGPTTGVTWPLHLPVLRAGRRRRPGHRDGDDPAAAHPGRHRVAVADRRGWKRGWPPSRATTGTASRCRTPCCRRRPVATSSRCSPSCSSSPSISTRSRCWQRNPCTPLGLTTPEERRCLWLERAAAELLLAATWTRSSFHWCGSSRRVPDPAPTHVPRTSRHRDPAKTSSSADPATERGQGRHRGGFR